MNVRTTLSSRLSSLRSPLGYRGPALLLAVVASSALAVNVLTSGEPAAHAAADQPVSVAAQLGITGSSTAAPSAEALRSLQALTASRSEREGETAAAARAQTMADQAKLAALAAAAQAQAEAQAAAEKAAAEKAAAEKAAADEAAADKAAADAAAQQQAQQKAAAAARPSGSFPAYALSKLGGNSAQFSCLQSLWGKESGWNPTAQNRSSTAYGIAQFLDSTWASTGIAKTSDGYRQIDAGLIYIDRSYGSPCGAWAHSRSYNWY